MKNLKALLTVFATVLLMFAMVPEAAAACEECKGHHTNRSCQEDENGNEGCQNNYTGQCINGTEACTGGSCGDGTGGCTPENKSHLDWLIPAGGEVLALPLPACEVPGLVIEA